MGLAIDGKVYAGGATYISDDIKVNFGLIDGKTQEPISCYLSNINEILTPGLYFTTLDVLNRLNGFKNFMHDYYYNAPVLVDVSAPNFSLVNTSIYVAFARLCYTQYCEKNNIDYNRYTVYSNLRGSEIPLFRPEELSDFTFTTIYSAVDYDIKDIPYSELPYITGVYYKGNQVDFLSVNTPEYSSPTTIYVGGYGVNYYLPYTGYVYMVPHLQGNTGKYIAIRPLESASFVYTANIPSSSGQRGYTFTPVGDPNNDPMTIIWYTKDRYLNLVNNITYSYLLEPGLISFGVDYNPNAVTAVGMQPYDKLFSLPNSFAQLNHIGVLPYKTYISPNTVNYVSEGDSSSCYLPLGKYRLYAAQKYANAPLDTGMTAINAYSPDGGITVKQEIFSDPALDSSTYHKFERLADSKGNFSSWSS